MRAVPDGFTGAIMAVDGISDGAVLLHGPGGCRVRHMVLSSAVYTREGDDVEFWEPYYYGYRRVPATYLDEQDFISGAYWKSEEGLEAVKARSPSIVMVVDSPGAGLIGDDHDGAIAEAGMADVAFRMDEPLASVPFATGVDHALVRAMEHIAPEGRGTRKGTVNILGISIMDKDWAAARDELRGYLEAMGLEVVCCPGAGSSVADMVRSVDSEFNVVVCPEMCARLSEWYSGFGVRTVRSPRGAPVGFDATEAWVRAIAEASGRDPSVPLAEIRRRREYVRDRFVGMRYSAGRIRGMRYSVAGIASVVRPLTEWLFEYLAMAPEAVAVDDGGDPAEVEALKGFLESKGYGRAWGREPVPCDVVLCEGVTAYTMLLSHECLVGIPIAHSSMGIDDVIPRPVYGAAGAMYILDELLHGARSARSGPPRLEQPVVQGVERHAPRYQHDEVPPGEVQVVRQGRRPYRLARVGQREQVEQDLEAGVQRGHGEERPAEEGHREDDEAVEGRHARVGFRDERGGEPEAGEHHARDDRADHQHRRELQGVVPRVPGGREDQADRQEEEARQHPPEEAHDALPEHHGVEVQRAHHHLVEAPVVQPLDVQPRGGGGERRVQRGERHYAGDDERDVRDADVRGAGPEPEPEGDEVEQRAHYAHHQDVQEVVLHEHQVAPGDVAGLHEHVRHVLPSTPLPVSSTNTSSRFVSLITTSPESPAANPLAFSRSSK